MTIQKLTTGGLAIGLFIGLSGTALVRSATAQNRNDDRGLQYGGSVDARQHGFEHAYRDGADRGRQDRESGMRYSLQANDYQMGARDFDGFPGDKTQYMVGYREGYTAGYDDGYGDRAGQYGQLYARPGIGSQEPVGNGAAAPRGVSSAHMAFDVGYRDGVTAGQKDQARNMRSDFRSTSAYQRADLGYQTSYGDRAAYTLQFRDGFERGYQDGYGRSRYSTDGGGYFPAPSRTGAIDTRDGQGTPDRSLVVAGNRQWTPTNIRVDQGETVWFQSTGEIRFTGSQNDRATPAGSPNERYISGAPLPRSLAGALIGRIDNGQPFGIGDQSSIKMPASGILYLGVNDDNVRDNSGQFQVVLSW